jgi:predicted dehydrogenase
MLGSVGSFRFLEGRSFNWPAQSASFFRRSEASGGVLIDTGAHTIDLLMWWLGGVGEVVEYADDAMGGVEANCSLRLAMGNGAEGYVQLSRDWPLPNRCVIECERGWIAYSCDVINRIEWGLFDVDYGLDTEIRAMAATRLTDGRSLAGPVPGMAECFAAQLRNVLAAISGCEPLAVSGTEARKTIVLVQKCYQNRRLLRMPWLADDERRRAEELSRA